MNQHSVCKSIDLHRKTINTDEAIRWVSTECMLGIPPVDRWLDVLASIREENGFWQRLTGNRKTGGQST